MVNINDIHDNTYTVHKEVDIPFICHSCIMKPMCTYTKSKRCRKEMKYNEETFLYPAFSLLRKYNAKLIIELKYHINDARTYSLAFISDIYIKALLDDDRILHIEYDRFVWHKHLLSAETHQHVLDLNKKYEIIATRAEKYIRIEDI